MVKNLPSNAWDLGLTPGLGRSPGEWHGNLLQYSLLENSHGQRSLAGYSPWGHERVGHKWVTNTSQSSLVPWKLCLILICPRITPKFKKTSLETDRPPTPWPFLHNRQCISLHFFAFTITISGFGAMSSTLTMPQAFLGRVRECL